MKQGEDQSNLSLSIPLFHFFSLKGTFGTQKNYPSFSKLKRKAILFILLSIAGLCLYGVHT